MKHRKQKIRVAELELQGCSQNAVNAGPHIELVISTASIDASSSNRPAEGAQDAKSSAAERTR